MAEQTKIGSINICVTPPAPQRFFCQRPMIIKRDCGASQEAGRRGPSLRVFSPLFTNDWRWFRGHLPQVEQHQRTRSDCLKAGSGWGWCYKDVGSHHSHWLGQQRDHYGAVCLEEENWRGGLIFWHILQTFTMHKTWLSKHKLLVKVNIINLRKTWEKLLLAARAIAAVKIP